MPDDKQNPLESNSSTDSNESSKVPGAVDVKQTSQENGSIETGKAPGSAETEQPRKESNSVASSKPPADAEQAAKGNASTEPGKAPGSADADQDLGEDVMKHSPKYLFDLRKSLGNITLVVGDNQSVTFNDYRGIVQGKIGKPPGGSADDEASNKTPGGTGELISENLKFERQSTTFFTGSESKDGATKLPETEEEFSQWYYGLGEYEQYYVQTAAVLHGAPAHEVSKRADSFYKLIREQVERRESSLRTESQQGAQRETQQRDSSRFTDPLLRRIPSRELRLRTHTITRRVNGVERLYWRDVDQYGLSTFGLQFLDFLSTEFISRGEHGQISLDVLKQWSEESSDEVSWKAAHSYGVVLWCHNADLLGQIAENWAKVRSFRSRRRTAELLDGAYEIDRVKNEEKIDGERTPSIVLRLLDEWVDRVHADFSVENMNGATNVAINLGCAVASTYGLIGKWWPEIALNGLEHLLQFPQSKSNDDTRNIFAAGVSTYVTLTWSGHVRIILERLASSAEQLSHQHSLPSKKEERQKYRRQREVRLNAIFEAFFLIAATALPGIQDNHAAPYSLTEPLPPHPAIPDPDGRDVLLAGLLSAGDVRESITTLLCAAIVEKKSRPAFGLLRFWAEAVLELRGTQDREAEEIYLSFRQFIVNLGITVARWCLDLEQQGFRSPQAVEVYKNRLKQWCIDGRYLSAPIASLAEEVLNQLGS